MADRARLAGYPRYDIVISDISIAENLRNGALVILTIGVDSQRSICMHNNVDLYHKFVPLISPGPILDDCYQNSYPKFLPIDIWKLNLWTKLFAELNILMHFFPARYIVSSLSIPLSLFYSMVYCLCLFIAIWSTGNNNACININTLRPRQNGRLFADDIFMCIILNEKIWISINISLKFVPKGQINNIPVLVQIMAWHRICDKPLSEPMMFSLLTHICVTRPQ